jgi:hypothetical protein
MDKKKDVNKLKSDLSPKNIFEISKQLGRIDAKLFIVIILLAGILIVAIADL